MTEMTVLYCNHFFRTRVDFYGAIVKREGRTFDIVPCCAGKCVTSRDTAQQLSLLADTYSLTCDILMHDTAAVTADTDTVGILTDIAGCARTDSHHQVMSAHVELLRVLSYLF